MPRRWKVAEVAHILLHVVAVVLVVFVVVVIVVVVVVIREEEEEEYEYYDKCQGGEGVAQQLWVYAADLLAPSHDNDDDDDGIDDGNVMGYYLNRRVRCPSLRSLPRWQRGKGG
jgi:hypothetical protein